MKGSNDFRDMLSKVPEDVRPRNDFNSRWLPHCYSVETRENVTEFHIIVALKDGTLKKTKVHSEALKLDMSTLTAHSSIFRNHSDSDCSISGDEDSSGSLVASQTASHEAAEDHCQQFELEFHSSSDQRPVIYSSATSNTG